MEKCPVCGNQTNLAFELDFKEIVGLAKDYVQEIRHCPECGFIYTGNPFSDEELSNRYKKFSKFEFDAKDYVLNESEAYIKRAQRQHSFIAANVDLDTVNSVFEVGASSGYNLSLYRNGTGVEPSAVNCKNAAEKYGVNLFCGMFDEYWKSIDKVSNKNKFDLVFLSHTLEHIVNPGAFVEKLTTICNRYFFIEVPTFDYKFVEEPFGMFCEEHVNMFTFESLERLMNKNGFKILDANMVFGIEQKLPAGWPAISTLWEKTGCSITSHKPVLNSQDMLDDYILASKNELQRIEEIIEMISDKDSVAIWGTGHHVSMLLANTSLSKKKIVKVYDSDKRKQGMTMLDIPICGFNEKDIYIYSKKVDCIVVATYTAQIAIERILEKYKNDVKVITLYKLDKE